MGNYTFCLGIQASLELEGVVRLFSKASNLISIRTTGSAIEVSLELPEAQQSKVIQHLPCPFDLNWMMVYLV